MLDCTKQKYFVGHSKDCCVLVGSPSFEANSDYSVFKCKNHPNKLVFHLGYFSGPDPHIYTKEEFLSLDYSKDSFKNEILALYDNYTIQTASPGLEYTYFNGHSKDCCKYLGVVDGHDFFKCSKTPESMVYGLLDWYEEKKDPLIETYAYFEKARVGDEKFAKKALALYKADPPETIAHFIGHSQECCTLKGIITTYTAVSNPLHIFECNTRPGQIVLGWYLESLPDICAPADLNYNWYRTMKNEIISVFNKESVAHQSSPIDVNQAYRNIFRRVLKCQS
jgi:hypothetical protein